MWTFVPADDSSYNQINDTATCQNEEALTRILRDELNFNG